MKFSKRALSRFSTLNTSDRWWNLGKPLVLLQDNQLVSRSTQMTLNTFHLAGHSAKNVTLGIPRLREIVMTASAKISTPSMQLYPHPELSKEDNEKFAKSITRLPLSAVIDNVTVTETSGSSTQVGQARTYKVRLDFYPAKEYTQEYAIRVRDVAESIEQKFCSRLQKVVRADLKKKNENKSLSTANSTNLPTIGQGLRTIDQQATENPEASANNEAGAGDDASDDDNEEEDATNAKARGRRDDSVGYDEPEEEEQAFNDKLDREEASEDDETYGGSPKPARAATPESASESESDDEENIIATDVLSDMRRERICDKNPDIVDFTFDDRKGAFCEVTFEFSSTTPKLLMLHHVEATANFSTIHVIPGITAAIFSPGSEKKDDDPVINAEGSNLLAMWEYGHIIDVNRIYTNDIVSVLNRYGVEACRATIAREMHNVFSGHGISVDQRHLSLIADTMTKGGGFTPFNRIGLAGNTSPFMKMTFETSIEFLKRAVMEKDWDDLTNPSARIVVGRLGGLGTGSFDILAPVTVIDPLKQAMEQEEEEEQSDVEIQENGFEEDDVKMNDVAEVENVLEDAMEEVMTTQETPKKKKKSNKHKGKDE